MRAVEGYRRRIQGCGLGSIGDVAVAAAKIEHDTIADRAADAFLLIGHGGAIELPPRGFHRIADPVRIGHDLIQGQRLGVARQCAGERSEEHTSELQSLMRISYAVFCLKKKQNNKHKRTSKS